MTRAPASAKRVPRIGILLGILASLGLVPVGSAGATTPAGEYASAAVRATNDARSAHDRRELSVDDCLKRKARQQAQRMADQQRIFHQDPVVIQDHCGMNWAGENVAYHYDSGQAVVDAWMQSPEHRANLLSRHFRRMGIAARMGGDGNWYVSQVFGRRG